MARPSKHFIPPSLERQLDHIEMIGNAEAQLAAQESIVPFRKAAKRTAGKVSVSERQHRLDTARQQFLQQTQKTKKLGFILLALVPLTCLTYAASLWLNNPVLGVMSLLLSGLLIGFGVVVIIMSRRNIKAISTIEPD